MEGLHEAQLDNYMQIEKLYTNYKKTPKDRLTTAYIEARYDLLESYWKDFQSRHSNLLTFPVADRKGLTYFNRQYYDTCADIYLDMKTIIKEKLSEIRSNVSEASDESQVHSKPSINTKLPAIQLPTFAGDYKNWMSYRELFKSLVHNNPSLSTINKCQYLKTSLQGEAENLVKQLHVSETNYSAIWETLNKRYNNKRSIVNAYIDKLINQRRIMTLSSKAIRDLLDTTTECLTALKNLQIPTESWDDLIVYITIQKLDPETHKLFEQGIELNKMPSWEQLQQFLEFRFRTLEAVKYKESSHTKSNTTNTKSFAITDNNNNVKCIYCQADHLLFQCNNFHQLNLTQRKEFVQKAMLCFNCLRKGHTSQKCLQSTKCKKCARKHHTLLHGYISNAQEPLHSEENKEINIQTTTAIHTGNSTRECAIVLATALVNVRSQRDDNEYTLRALVDQGSQACLITEASCQLLGFKRVPISGNVTGVGSSKSITKSRVEFDIMSRHNPSISHKVNAYVLSTLTSCLPQKTQFVEWTELKELQLADPTFYQPGKIDLILGADIYAEILQEGMLSIREETQTLIAQRTTIGWLISGKSKSRETHQEIHIHHTRVEIDTLLKSFWELEEKPEKRAQTNLEKRCEQFYEDTHERLEDGRYKVRLPFISNPPDLGESLTIAEQRLKYLEKRLKSNTDLKVRYDEFMRDYLQQNHMEIIEEKEITTKKEKATTTEKEKTITTEKEIPNKAQTHKEKEIIKEKVCYLPHHAVVNEQHLTTKLRVVFDSSAKTNNGKSLNENLMIGPALQNDIRDVTLKWRKHRVVLIGDIKQMYRQIQVHRADTDFQRIIYRFDDHIQHFRLTTVTYGTSCAPYLAIKTLKQLTEDERPNFREEIIETALNDFYVDDLLTGHSTEDGVRDLKQELIQLLHKGGFILHKWATNSPNIEGAEQTTRKILGINWNSYTDKFELRITLPPVSNQVTIRTVLGDIAKIYDPAGWLAPVVIVAKSMLQKLWLNNLEWDDNLTETLRQEWICYREELEKMPTIELQRWIGITEDVERIELHGFSDASTIAYSAVVYLRVITSSEILVTMIEARTRVAPVKQVSLPRLELCGAVLLAKLLYRIQSALSIPNQHVYAWTDATIVLAWLQRSPSYWTTFVANRVTEIINVVEKERWHHVSSHDNPADVASRGISPTELPNHILWWKGPEWLQERDTLPTRNIDDEIESTEEEMKIKVHMSVVSDKTVLSESDTSVSDFGQYLLERHSNLRTLVRVTAYIMRFYTCMRQKVRVNLLFPKYLQTKELHNSLTLLLKLSQQIHFKKEINIIKNDSDGKSKFTNLKKTVNGCKIAILNPYIDDDNLLRVGGRIEFADINKEMKHPVILSKDCKLSYLIVKDIHYKTLHGGIQLMLNVIRTKFHIIRVKDIVKRIIHECISCRKNSGKIANQLMGNLPIDRVTPQRPFLVSGVDFAGPVVLKLFSGKCNKTQKAYIALFICTAVKAIHLELVTSLSSEAFIAAFRRFTSRRGHCRKLISDCGTNFIGASKELKDMFNASSDGLPLVIAELLSKDGTEWQFNPAGAPHMGGIWEAAVKCTKFHLNRVLNDTKLTYEEYCTLLCQIESCLNSRPLTPLNEYDNGIVDALTPGHFLIGENPIVVPEKSLENVKVPYLHRWVFLQQKLQSFWRKWSQEYLVNLQKRYKWASVQTNVDIGSIVLIKDERLPPAKWLLGKVVATHPGADGLTRVVSIKCRDTVIKRPIHKLCVLPTNV